MFETLRAKITGHHDAHPLKAGRDEFLAITADTPLEQKSHFTPAVVGSAAAYETFKAFENHEVHAGDKPTHARAKEIIQGIAIGYAGKMVDERGLPFASDANATKFKTEAQAYAVRDAKRALRESGYFEQHELDPIEEDEKVGHQIA